MRVLSSLLFALAFAAGSAWATDVVTPGTLPSDPAPGEFVWVDGAAAGACDTVGPDRNLCAWNETAGDWQFVQRGGTEPGIAPAPRTVATMEQIQVDPSGTSLPQNAVNGMLALEALASGVASQCTLAAGPDQVVTEGGSCGAESHGQPVILTDAPALGACSGVPEDPGFPSLCCYSDQSSGLEPCAAGGGGGTDDQDAAEVPYTGTAPSNYAPGAAHVEGHLLGIDTVLGSVGSGSSIEDECTTDPDCYWIEDDDGDNDVTDELQEAGNTAFGSGATKPTHRWRFLMPGNVMPTVTDTVRWCEDADATGSTLPDCDSDFGELLSNEQIFFDLRFRCSIDAADETGVKNGTESCLWIGDGGDKAIAAADKSTCDQTRDRQILAITDATSDTDTGGGGTLPNVIYCDQATWVDASTELVGLDRAFTTATVAGLGTCDASNVGEWKVVTDPADEDDCSVGGGGGPDTNSCRCVPSSGGGYAWEDERDRLNYTTHGFDVDPVRGFGRIEIIQESSTDSLTDNNEVWTPALLIERPFEAQGLTVSATFSDDPAVLNQTGPGDTTSPACFGGFTDCFADTMAAFVGVSGLVELEYIPQEDETLINDFLRVFGPSDVSLHSSKPGGPTVTLGTRPFSSSGFGNVAATRWSGLQWYTRIHVTEDSFFNSRTEASIQAFHSELTFDGTLYTPSISPPILTTAGVDCASIYFRGRVRAQGVAANPLIRIDGLPQGREEECFFGAHDAFWEQRLQPGPQPWMGHLDAFGDNRGIKGTNLAPVSLFSVSNSHRGIQRSRSPRHWWGPVGRGPARGWQVMVDVPGAIVREAVFSGTVPTVSRVVNAGAVDSGTEVGTTVNEDGQILDEWTVTDNSETFTGTVDPGDWFVAESATDPTDDGLVVGIASVADADTLNLDLGRGGSAGGWGGSGFGDSPTVDNYKIVEPRCWDWINQGWAVCGAPGSPTVGTDVRHDGLWSMHRLEIEVLEDVVDASCTVMVLRNGVDAVSENRTARQYVAPILGHPNLDEAGESYHVTMGEVFDAADDDYLQLAIGDSPDGDCLEGGTDLGMVRISIRTTEDRPEVRP